MYIIVGKNASVTKCLKFFFAWSFVMKLHTVFAAAHLLILLYIISIYFIIDLNLICNEKLKLIAIPNVG